MWLMAPMSQPRIHTLSLTGLYSFSCPKCFSGRLGNEKNGIYSCSGCLFKGRFNEELSAVREKERELNTMKLVANVTNPFTILVENDYDGYFESFVRSVLKDALKQGKKLKYTTYVISTGGFRMYDFAWEVKKDDPTVVRLDFYSVLRHRGGPDDEELMEVACV